MLILTRRSRESIRVGEQIAISTLEIRGNPVRVGIAAPADGLVRRAELVETSRGDIPSARSRTPQ